MGGNTDRYSRAVARAVSAFAGSMLGGESEARLSVRALINAVDAAGGVHGEYIDKEILRRVAAEIGDEFVRGLAVRMAPRIEERLTLEAGQVAEDELVALAADFRAMTEALVGSC
jgi:hypothetical protein